MYYVRIYIYIYIYIYICIYIYIYIAPADFSPWRTIENAKKYLRAGPRKHIFFQPEEVKVAIVTCGGLCPGLNVVIREIVMSCYYNYGIRSIYGIKFGYKGFYEYAWEELTP